MVKNKKVLQVLLLIFVLIFILIFFEFLKNFFEKDPLKKQNLFSSNGNISEVVNSEKLTDFLKIDNHIVLMIPGSKQEWVYQKFTSDKFSIFKDCPEKIDEAQYSDIFGAALSTTNGLVVTNSCLYAQERTYNPEDKNTRYSLNLISRAPSNSLVFKNIPYFEYGDILYCSNDNLDRIVFNNDSMPDSPIFPSLSNGSKEGLVIDNGQITELPAKFCSPDIYKTKGIEFLFKGSKKVYYLWNYPSEGLEISLLKNLNPKSVIEISPNPKSSFRIFSDGNLSYYVQSIGDETGTSFFTTEMKIKDISTFKFLEIPYAKDSIAVYYGSNIIENADSNSFQILSNNYSKDENNIYYGSRIIPGANKNSFQILYDEFSDQIVRDENSLYFGDQKILDLRSGENLKVWPRDYLQNILLVVYGNRLHLFGYEKTQTGYYPKKELISVKVDGFKYTKLKFLDLNCTSKGLLFDLYSNDSINEEVSAESLDISEKDQKIICDQS
jgi:hypothetical protein